MSAPETSAYFRWLETVAGDCSLPPNAFRLAFTIGQHINRKTGTAWPSQARLAKLLGITERAVRKLTDALVKAGHIVTKPSPGQHQAITYSLPPDRNFRSARPEHSFTQTGTPVPPNLYSKPLMNLGERAPSRARPHGVESWEEVARRTLEKAQ